VFRQLPEAFYDSIRVGAASTSLYLVVGQAARILGTATENVRITSEPRVWWDLGSVALADRFERLLEGSEACALSLVSRRGTQVHGRWHGGGSEGVGGMAEVVRE
jgi:hypothetical protein